MVWTICNENRRDIVNKIYHNPQSDICQIKISRKRAEDWDIVVEASTPQYQERLSAALLIAGLPRNEVITTFYRLRTDNMAAIVNFMKVIKANEPNFEAIERDISECLGINLNQNYPTPCWIKSTFNGSGTESMDYRTADAGSIINRISLYKEERINSWTVKVFTNTPDHKQLLQTAIATSILPPNWITLDDMDTGLPFALRYASTAMIANFIKTIKPLTQRFEDIEAEISQKLDIDLNQEYPMPASETRSAPIMSTIASMIDQEINNGGTLSPRPRQTLSDANLRIVQQSIRPRAPALPVDPRTPTLDRRGVNFNRTGFFNLPSDRDYFVHFSHVSDPRPLRSDPLVISQGFFGGTRYGHQSLAQPQFPTSVTSGNNEKRMENIANFSPTEIPEHYKCPLSLTIMTDPVYLPSDTTQQRFERSWITAWLDEKGTHPSTRERFQSNVPVSDAELKKEINEFLQTEETAIKRQLS